jgi:hypothetical protein
VDSSGDCHEFCHHESARKKMAGRVAGAAQAVLVAQAETGLRRELPMAEHHSVHALKEAVQAATGVPTTYQILLLDGDKLEDEQTLAEYMLPNLHASARPVFLFDRRSLSRSATPPEEGRPAAPDVQVPEALPDDDLPRRVELQSIASPLMSALLDYERRFRLHLLQATTLCEGGSGRLEAARQLLVAQDVQAAALTAAVANLRGFAQQLSEKYASFQARYAEVVPRQAALVRSFDTDLEVLRSIRVQPAVCALEGLREASLLDCCGQERLASWLHECQNNTDHLMAKAAQFALQWEDLQARKPHRVVGLGREGARGLGWAGRRGSGVCWWREGRGGTRRAGWRAGRRAPATHREAEIRAARGGRRACAQRSSPLPRVPCRVRRRVCAPRSRSSCSRHRSSSRSRRTATQ